MAGRGGIYGDPCGHLYGDGREVNPPTESERQMSMAKSYKDWVYPQSGIGLNGSKPFGFTLTESKRQMSEEFPTLKDFELRDKIAAAFLAAKRTWNHDNPNELLLGGIKFDAEELAGIAVTIIRKESTIPLVTIRQE